MKNIKGERLNNFVITKYLFTSKNYAPKWECKCLLCGRISKVSYYVWKDGKKGKCKCQRFGSRFKDISGKKYGRLTALELSKITKRGSYWSCLCRCGNTKIISLNALESKNTISCGCYAKEQTSKRSIKNLRGMRFGILKVIKRGENYINNNGKTFPKWLCKCDCGNKKEIRATHLLSGATKSCGCLKESFLANELKKHFKKNYGAILEKKVYCNPNGKYPLRFDIYLPKNKIFIEIQGVQHYYFIPFWHKTKENFERSKLSDASKKKYAQKNGIYITIDLRKIKTFDKAIEYIKNKTNKDQKS